MKTQKKAYQAFLSTCMNLVLLIAIVWLSSSCSTKEEQPPYLNVELQTLQFSHTQETRVLKVESSSELNISLAEDTDTWCYYSFNPKDPTELEISVNANPVAIPRETVLTISMGELTSQILVKQNGSTGGDVEGKLIFPQVASDVPLSALTDEKGNIIPDFSNIGYRGSEVELPEVKIVKTLEAPSGDATYLIQNAIDEVAQMPLVDGFRGAILLKAGLYKVYGSLYLKTSGVVLRGEGDGYQDNEKNVTHIQAARYDDADFIVICGQKDKVVDPYSSFNITDEYVPVGLFWVTVSDPERFQVGDDVIVFRPGTQKWISDIRMDQIPGEAPWNPSGYNMSSERRITHIKGNVIYFDNPIMQAIEAQYGGGAVRKSYFTGRVKNCGIENIRLSTYYKEDTDLLHCWKAIDINYAEHCWVRGVSAQYFVKSLAVLESGARFVTIKDCHCLDAKYQQLGSRAYSYHIDGAQQCLVIDCTSNRARHGVITGRQGVGPSAFVRCTITGNDAESGPHERCNVGTLYDNVSTIGGLSFRDRKGSGSGHGLTGISQVAWNCNAKDMCIENPFAAGRNFTIGSRSSSFWYQGDRTKGVWVRNNSPVLPVSLFDAQLALRKQMGRLYHQKGIQ